MFVTLLVSQASGWLNHFFAEKRYDVSGPQLPQSEPHASLLHEKRYDMSVTRDVSQPEMCPVVYGFHKYTSH